MEKQNEIFENVRDTMVELFDLDPDSIKPESLLVDDLDLDSIDAVDMIVKLQKETGRRIKPEEFRSVKTVGDVVEVLQRLSQDQQ